MHPATATLIPAEAETDATDEVPNERATETEPAITPPQATNG